MPAHHYLWRNSHHMLLPFDPKHKLHVFCPDGDPNVVEGVCFQRLYTDDQLLTHYPTRFPSCSSSLQMVFSSYSKCKLHDFWHDSHPLCMDRTQICILKKSHAKCLHSLLHSQQRCSLITCCLNKSRFIRLFAI